MEPERLSYIDFNYMICEAIGVNIDHVYRYVITGTGEDVTVEIEWAPSFVKPGNPLKGRFYLEPASPDTSELRTWEVPISALPANWDEIPYEQQQQFMTDLATVLRHSTPETLQDILAGEQPHPEEAEFETQLIEDGE